MQETVEIEARVNGSNGGLKSAVIEIRRETSGEIIATGRLWMAPLSVKAIQNVSTLSKLWFFLNLSDSISQSQKHHKSPFWKFDSLQSNTHNGFFVVRNKHTQ